MFFHRQQCVGLDFSDSSFEAMQLHRGLGRPAIFGYNRMLIPGGIITDGVIQQPAAIAEMIKKLVHSARPQPIKTRWCLFSLPDSQVFASVIQVPQALEGEGLKRQVLHEAPRIIPLALDQLYFDYRVIAETGEFKDVIFVAALKSVVHDYIAVLNAAGLFPLALDIESASIARALLQPDDDKRHTLLVDLGARTTNLSFYSHGRIQGIHTLPLGGNDMTEAIIRIQNTSFSKADEIKKHIGAHLHPTNELGRAVELVLRELVVEIKKIIQFYSYKKQATADALVLAGGTALLPGLHKYFRRHFNQRVEIRNPLRKLSLTSQEYVNGRALLFSNVVGLALRGVSASSWHHGFNLLHKVSKPAVKKQVVNV